MTLEAWRLLFGGAQLREAVDPEDYGFEVIGRAGVDTPINYPEGYEWLKNPKEWQYLNREFLPGRYLELYGDYAVRVLARAKEVYVLEVRDSARAIFLADKGLVESQGFNPSLFEWGQK